MQEMETGLGAVGLSSTLGSHELALWPWFACAAYLGHICRSRSGIRPSSESEEESSLVKKMPAYK